jgi:hypothetical protein
MEGISAQRYIQCKPEAIKRPGILDQRPIATLIFIKEKFGGFRVRRIAIPAIPIPDGSVLQRAKRVRRSRSASKYGTFASSAGQRDSVSNPNLHARTTENLPAAMWMHNAFGVTLIYSTC